MQKKYIPAITMLIAGAVTCIASIANKIDKLLSLEILLGVLIVFYIIGMIAKAIITKVIESEGIKEEEETKTVEDNAEESEISQEETEMPEGSKKE
ncbi:MAG: hypothetical protein ACERKN_05915 [Velocimicrobium sp.]